MFQTFDEIADPSHGAERLKRLRAELTRRGLDGFLVPPGDVEGLRARITELRDDPGMREGMRANAFARFRELPTWGESMGAARGYLASLLER